MQSSDGLAAFPTRLLIKMLEEFQSHLMHLPHSEIQQHLWYFLKQFQRFSQGVLKGPSASHLLG